MIPGTPVLSLATLALAALAGGRQDAGSGAPELAVPDAVATGVARLVAMQEGEGPSEWPYEGVYRVRDESGASVIPIGYRVGGTAIVATTLMQSPGYAEDAAAQAAVARGLRFVLDSTEHPLMDPDYAGGYDVRGWGYAYAVAFLARMKRLELEPEGQAGRAEKGLRWYVKALQQIEIPENGGWSYSRGRKLGDPSPPSAFMTAPCLQALFEAEAQGAPVDARVVERGLDALQRGVLEGGAVSYAVGRSRDRVPGAVGRMLATETTLALAGRSDAARVRAALDAFLVHWRWLDARRAQTGTHVAPYGVAPYYFYYAHYHAALAIEFLPAEERDEYRARLRELLSVNRLEDGTWNDRVFPRTANYGTSMATLALMMPALSPPAEWGRAKRAR